MFVECIFENALCEDFCDCIFIKPLPADFMYEIFCMLCQHPEDSDVTDDLFMGQMRSSPDRQHNYSFHLPPVPVCPCPGLSIRFEQVHSLETKITASLSPLQVVSHFCFY